MSAYEIEPEIEEFILNRKTRCFDEITGDIRHSVGLVSHFSAHCSWN